MPKTRKQKEEVVDSLGKMLKGATSAVFVGFNKLKVSDERDLRNKLRDSGVSYMVAKKTLISHALTGAGLKLDAKWPGQVAVAMGADPVMPAKGIAEFSKKHEGVTEILGGIFEGKLQDSAFMKSLASIPSRENLLGMLANVLSAPMRGLAIAVDAIAKQKAV